MRFNLYVSSVFLYTFCYFTASALETVMNVLSETKFYLAGYFQIFSPKSSTDVLLRGKGTIIK